MGCRPMQNAQFGSKIKNAKKGAKNDSTTTLKLLCAKKTDPKNTLNIGKMTTVSKWPESATDAWAIAHAKCSVWVKN